MTLGTKIRHFRQDKGISQLELAELLDIAQTTVSNFESDKTVPDIKMIDKMSKVLDKNITDFLSSETNHFINEGQKGGMTFQNIGKIKTVNGLSEKLIEQYEVRIKEKDDLIKLLKEQLKLK
ncbi:helix-turn-helix transcriptional regulator [uncultured Winogradskyella sp.]|uniref:helix-turn-helix domain-containing protein n=1 Tax=uncultured Winogradskyella sp. TaxID=395353 RepID=UPI00262A5A24|nr:helix-turn-helix transcriptional regulator [uncultured Winogradskyella sp.]